MSNQITAYFKGRTGVAEPVYQNDYGMVLNFDGIYLPSNFDCHFSVLGSDTAIPGVGADNRVAIPNTVLSHEGNVTVHIPLHTGSDDSEVEYVVYFKVIGRARPVDDGTPEQQTAISEAIALLNSKTAQIPEDLQNYYDSHIAPTITDDVSSWLDEHPEATTTVQDGSLSIDKLESSFKQKLQTASEKYVQNTDGAVSIMGDVALSYIKYTDLSNETSSEFFYDTSGIYSNWSSNPTTEIDGKHGISCSPFVMDMIFGVRYENSAYIDGQNKLDSIMLKDDGLINYFYTPNIGTRYLAEYAIANGYAFYPNDDLSNIRPGDVLFTTLAEDTEAPYGVGHCEVVAYWINDSKFLVWHGGANAPRPNVRVASSYAERVKLCARFPLGSKQLSLLNLVKSNEAYVSHSVNSTWLIAEYDLSESLEANKYYTAVFKMTSENTIADQYPVIRNASGDNLSQSYSGATRKPENNIYCVPFWSNTSINKIRLGMTKASESVSYANVTVEWMAVVKGIVTDADEFILPQYTEPVNDVTELMTAGKVGTITPTSGTPYASWGNCYYYKIGKRVHVHIGISGLTANSNTTIYTLPAGFRPRGNVIACGQGDETSDMAKLSVAASGAVKIWSAKTYALVDIDFDAFQ